MRLLLLVDTIKCHLFALLGRTGNVIIAEYLLRGSGRIKDNQHPLEEISLRKHAEKLLKKRADGSDEASNMDVHTLIHELRVHQIELETQNEELRRAQVELEESLYKYADFYDFAPIGYFTLDKRGLIQEVNLTGSTLLGVQRKYLINRPFFSYIAGESRDIFHLFLKRFYKHTAAKQSCELTIVRKDNTTFYAQLEGIAVFNGDGNPGHFKVAMLDITERKLAEEQVREQAVLLNIATDAIIIIDMENNILFWNKGAEQVYGWKTGEAIGKKFNDLLFKETPPEFERVPDIVKERGEWKGELHQVTKDNKEIIVESRWILVRDAEGSPKSILTVNTDVTEKKKLEAQFLRAQSIETVGVLAGGTAHNLNNVLTPIMLGLGMLKGKLTDEKSSRLIGMLETNTQRAAHILKQILSFAGGIGYDYKIVQVQVDHLISEISETVKGMLPRSIEVQTDISKDLWFINGDIAQLHQVLMNLCINARDAMPDGGRLSICAENFYIDQNYAKMNTDASVGPYVVITVSDTGSGIPPEIIDKIFEPFFTTKGPSKGTGLGLPSVLRIVKSHGGFIRVSSRAGKGAQFKIYLPVAESNYDCPIESNHDYSETVLT
ncbi:MAG TPA: PAS domain S-box protein [Thermodesulfobacteriota bacterium]|nr:PAS domain S-box protein [Thermodesulfobacteriota bacterium]